MRHLGLVQKTKELRGNEGKMKIPKIIKIGGHQYKIIFPYVFTERFDRVADHDFSIKEIRIVAEECNVKRADSGIIVTLIHEILHAIDGNSGHDMFHGNDGEKRIQALSEGIYQVLVDNPKLKDLI